MKKSELKEMIKPIVQECVRESVQQVLLESGLLSSVISEVIKGLERPLVMSESNHTQADSKQKQAREVKKSNKEISNKLDETRKKMMKAIGKDSYGGVNVFEGTKPSMADSSPSAGALRDTDPSDSGVDISSIMNESWAKLI